MTKNSGGKNSFISILYWQNLKKSFVLMAVYKMNHGELFGFGVWFGVSRSLQVDFCWELSFFKIF